jgi:hypothetical protein
MLTQPMRSNYEVLPAAGAARSPARVIPIDKVEEAYTGHSRWEIAALVGTLFLVVPFGLMILLGL